MNPAQLLAHFDRISEAPDAIPRLRRFILDLAVRGKVVEQDPNDESASELLERIQTEKARLVKDWALRKQKPLPPVSQDELPFRLPRKWRCSQLAEVGFINPRNTADDGLAASFVPMHLISAEFGVATNQEVRPWGEIKSGYTHFAEGDVGLAKITPCFENGKSAVFRGLTNGIGAGTTELHVVRPVLSDPDYLLIFLKCPHFIESGIPQMTGTAGQKRVPTDYFAHAPLPLPPLADQHRIVAKVNELMALCDRLEAAQAEREQRRDRLAASSLHRLNQPTDGGDPSIFQKHARFHLAHLRRVTTRPDQIPALRQTILNLAVRGRLVPQDPNDEPAPNLLVRVAVEKTNAGNAKTGRDWVLDITGPVDGTFRAPPGWAWTRIANAVERVTVGYVGPMKDQYVEGGIPFLRSQNVRANRFRPDGLISISPKFHQAISKSALAPRDVVVVRSGNVGTACVIPPSLPEANCSDLVVVKNPMAVDPTYLCFYLNSLAVAHIEAGTVGVALTHFNTKSVATMPLPLPPLAEQHRIVARVEELMAVCDRLEAQLTTAQTESRRLLEAVLHEALAPAA
jgi:type I restriction enzyme S subunit